MRGDTPGGPIRWKMHVPATPEKVFQALNTDEGRASFWAVSAKEENGFIAFQFINGMSDRSRILERVASRIFAIEYFGSEARFDLEPDGAGGCDVLLTHQNVEAEVWNEVHAGWLNVLFPLKAMVGFGIDLRNNNPKRLWEHGYADQ